MHTGGRMKLVSSLLVFAVLAIPLSAAGQAINQWKDPKTGSTIFSDQPPPAGAQVIQRYGGEPGEGGQQFYATRIAAEKFPVILYTAADCVEQCAKARELLNGRGAPFTEKLVPVGDGPEMSELKALTGGEAVVPLLLVGKQKFKGFDAGSWNNLLDLAGYPKVASPGSKPSGAFAQ